MNASAGGAAVNSAPGAAAPPPAVNVLSGQTVLVTAVRPHEREALAASIAAAGGQFTGSVSLRDPPHLVITRSVKSPKYRALLRVHPHTPVVTPEWLSACVQARRVSALGGSCLGAVNGNRRRLPAAVHVARQAAAGSLAG